MGKMRRLMQSLFVGCFLFGFAVLFPHLSHAAISFTMDAPSGELTRGESYDFTVSINTGTDAVTTTQANVNYDSAALQLVSVTQGNFFDSVTYQQTGTGTVLLTGTNSTAKSGSGSFAILKFTLVATSAGSTELCTVSPVDNTPSLTPSPTPGAGEGPTVTPVPTTPPIVPTNPPQVIPTGIPTAGAIAGWQIGIIASLVLLGLGAVGMLLL
ncbi:MAG: cohesin domain-containing protein [Patescibacteria group bacterium]